MDDSLGEPRLRGLTLILFARAPVLGRVKTRLARTIGDQAALDLYRAFLEDACSAAARQAPYVILCVDGDPEHVELRALAARHGFSIAQQAEGDLGARMAHAFAVEHARGHAACIFGSDAPLVSRDDLADACERMIVPGMVVGPSTDGGYWLIGSREPRPGLFAEMAWSTPSVLSETLRRLRGTPTALLRFHYDVDDAEDLALLRAHLPHLPDEVAPATRRALAKLTL